MCNVLLTSCEDGVCRLWSETLLPEDSLLGGQISENTQSFSSCLPGLAGNKDKIQHALEVHQQSVSFSDNASDVQPVMRWFNSSCLFA